MFYHADRPRPRTLEGDVNDAFLFLATPAGAVEVRCNCCVNPGEGWLDYDDRVIRVSTSVFCELLDELTKTERTNNV